VTNRLISQLVGAGTSVGANYVEADDSVSKGSPGDKTFPSHGRARTTGVKTGGSEALAGSQRTASDLFQNLEEREMISFIRHSSFVIRHFPHA
jgi:hypothetical protein